LKEYYRNTYTTLLKSGRLNAYLADIDKKAQEIFQTVQYCKILPLCGVPEKADYL